MPTYNGELFDPPAPLASVIIRNPKDANTISEVPMLLDSGSDVTLIPTSFVNQIDRNLEADSLYELMGFDGSISLASAVWLELIFLNRVFRGRFLTVDREWGVLGRDVLNLVSLIFDGPNLAWNERKER